MITSVIMDISTQQAQAPAGSEEELRNFRYAATRLAALSNLIMLKGYEHMFDFFTTFEWWKTSTHDVVMVHLEPGKRWPLV